MACPLCQNPPREDFFPFCSKTCKSSDLLGWLNEQYRIPVEEPTREEEDQNE